MILDKIEDRISQLRGDIGISYMDLTTGTGCFAGNCDVFPSSGMAKLALLCGIFDCMEAGILSGDDFHVLTKEDCRCYMNVDMEEPTYGAISFLHEGLELTLRDLYRLMITVSDNTAFNILLEKIGIVKVNEILRKLGMEKTSINRKFFDFEKIGKGVENYHSVKEVADIYGRLFMGQMISGESSAEMLELMRYHQRTNIIPYYFPENLKIAHQTGFDEGIIHDAGIVYGENPFILCMSAGNTDTRKAESVMRDVALICYKHSNS